MIAIDRRAVPWGTLSKSLVGLAHYVLTLCIRIRRFSKRYTLKDGMSRHQLLTVSLLVVV